MEETSTPGVHQMRLLHRLSLYHCFFISVDDSSLSKTATFVNRKVVGTEEQTERRIIGRTDGPKDGHDLVASKEGKTSTYRGLYQIVIVIPCAIVISFSF